MSSVEALLSARRSIRRYKPEMPGREMVEAMLASAASAPSPSNSRPVRFIGLTSKAVREGLRKGLEAGKADLLHALEANGGPRKARNLVNAYYRFSEFMVGAPLLFAVGTREIQTFSKKLVDAGALERDARPGTDLAISVGLSLKAFIMRGEELGIGSCILTAPLVFLNDVESLLSCEDLKIHCFIAAGFPDETPGIIERSTVADIYREI